MRPSAYTARIDPIQLHKNHPGFRRSSEPFSDPSKSQKPAVVIEDLSDL